MNLVVNGLVVIIVSYIEFASRYEEIDAWCRETFGYDPRQGMVLTFSEESHLMWFQLKYAMVSVERIK